MIKKKPQPLLCKYCEYYRNSSKRQVDSSNNTPINYRKCKVKNDYVREKEKACDSFKLASKLFCPINEYWVTSEMCLARVSKRICSKNCKIYKLIKEILNV
jgi:hypothetical protein